MTQCDYCSKEARSDCQRNNIECAERIAERKDARSQLLGRLVFVVVVTLFVYFKNH